METTVEINNVDGCPEPPRKEPPIDDTSSEIMNVSETTESVDDPPELMQSEKSATSDKDKELTWEKIAAEFTEDEEDAPEEIKAIEQEKVAEAESVAVPEPETFTENLEVIEETEVLNESVAESEGAPPVQDEVQAQPVNETAEAEVIDEVVEAEADNGKTEEKPPEVIEEDSVKESTIDVEEPVAGASVAEEVVEEHSQVEEVIEISELKSEESSQTNETVEDVEYTVIEAEEVETNEIIEEHLAQANSNSDSVIIINPDDSQTEITIEQVEESDKNEEIYIIEKDNEAAVDDPGEFQDQEVKEIKPKKQRGRKPISDIPLHVLGRDITKPSEGVSNGGRIMPKPRLGVKVPYRNLTSQIVSKEEIEKEIMERFKLKQEQNLTNSGDILFARKLTQRLAKKLIPSEKEKPTENNPEATASVSNQQATTSETEIKNNSDLIAILEGEGDEIPISKQAETAKEQIVRNTEKEIALKQLKELPLSPKNKFFKSRSEEAEKKPPPPAPQSTNPKSAQPAKKPETTSSPVKSAVEKKNPHDIEPRLKTGMVIKTYTRKRKSSDLDTILPPKKSVVAATTIKSEEAPSGDVYMTKSSRIIKKKVIWDPDEAPVKSPIKSPKPEASPPKSSPVKAVKTEPTNKNTERKIPVPVKKAAVRKTPTPPPATKKPKRLTEVDKLLMDEGAVNMLYDVKTNEESIPDKLKTKNSNKNVISLDKAHKELMSKTKVIRNELQQNTNKEVQKVLRKKEVSSPSPPKKEPIPVPISRKKSKDSARSSVHSPPASPFNTAEASRIIRRHSSSSFSSTDGVNEDDSPKKRSSVSGEVPKKKFKKNSDTKSIIKEAAKNNNNSVSENKSNHVDNKSSKTFTTTKKNKLTSIKLNKESKFLFSEQVLKDLTNCLKELGKDEDCHVVSLTSDSNESFCLGLDYRSLVTEDEQVRKKKATELATLVKEFLRCLLNFPKVLVAGVQGECTGLGVTMLPLFDMVIASDTSTFSAPYAKLGCAPEAGFLLTVPHLSGHGLASELLYTSQVMKADDAFRRGLVTKLCWPEKYNEELKSMLSQVAGQSKQSILATKQQLRHHLVQSTESLLNSASKVWIEHWISSECQKNFLK